MAEKKLVDYYGVLRVPAGAELTGIEAAYARLSNEFALRMEVDETSGEALRRLNEAYSVLSHPELRRQYDSVFFATDIAREEADLKRAQRRQKLTQWLLVGALGLVVLAQAAALLYVGRGEISSIFGG